MNRTKANQHLRDDELMRWMSDEADADERERLRAHLALCDACAADAEGLRQQTARVSARIAELQPPPLRARGARQRTPKRAAAAWLVRLPAAAALVLVLVTAVVGTASLSAWVAERWERVTAFFAGAEAERADPAPAAEPVPRPAVWVPAEAGRLRLELANPLGGTTIRVERADGPGVAVDIPPELIAQAPVVGEGLIRIANVPAREGEIVVRVSRELAQLELRIAGQRTRVLEGSQLDAGVTIDDRNRAAQPSQE